MINLPDSLIKDHVEFFKGQYGVRLDSAERVFETQRKLLEYLMGMGRMMENELFRQAGNGYAGSQIQKERRLFKFVGYRANTIHGLFGSISYRRAYYVSQVAGGGSYVPIDQQLGIEKRHTPGLTYFLSSFTGREVYGRSLEHFHEIFRPDGTEKISHRKAVEMDYELGKRLEAKRQQEIQEVFKKQKALKPERPISGVVAVSMDATKAREKLGETVNDEGEKSYKIGFRDVKLGCVSAVDWDEEEQQARCTETTYVSGIEHADEFFKRLWVEMNRRCANLGLCVLVFLGDGAKWIWDRVPELANATSLFILDFYHAAEHISQLAKALYGEQTPKYWQHFERWRQLLWDGKVNYFIAELKEIRDGPQREKHGKLIQGELNYFQEHQDKMRYPEYRARGLPIGSGTVESGCKNVIGGRLKQGGMTWSPHGADAMLQIRTSQENGRFSTDFPTILPKAS
jgi:hypothetical protein|tara:strand:- start:30 stop:1400 length:1371 start_codon:yes stop_codon:yes gene_type:complete